MEGSFSKEIYSETLQQLSKTELSTPHPTSVDKHLTDLDGALLDDNGSIWDDGDGDWDESSSLDREWQKRRDQYHTIGYRDGLLAAKDSIAQEGFNTGFKQSVLVGYNWGVARGVTSAISCLPNELKERMIKSQEKRNKYQELYGSINSISTADALKLFHDNFVAKKAVEQNEETAKVGSDIAGSQKQSSDLEDYVGELHSLLLESPTINSHLSVN